MLILNLSMVGLSKQFWKFVYTWYPLLKTCTSGSSIGVMYVFYLNNITWLILKSFYHTNICGYTKSQIVAAFHFSYTPSWVVQETLPYDKWQCSLFWWAHCYKMNLILKQTNLNFNALHLLRHSLLVLLKLHFRYKKI